MLFGDNVGHCVASTAPQILRLSTTETQREALHTCKTPGVFDDLTKVRLEAPLSILLYKSALGLVRGGSLPLCTDPSFRLQSCRRVKPGEPSQYDLNKCRELAGAAQPALHALCGEFRWGHRTVYSDGSSRTQHRGEELTSECCQMSDPGAAFDNALRAYGSRLG